jgi:malonyl CoA-acyl carrier protein transacylase
MKKTNHKAIAIVGVGAVMPDAIDLPTFWNNIKTGKYSISDVPKDRWDPDLYYDADPKAPDKTYSRIGGWVREWKWDPIGWRLPIPPKVSDLMDLTQILAISASREALQDFGYPGKQFDTDRTAVIFGNAMGGDQHLYSSARVLFPEFEKIFAESGSFAAMPEKLKRDIMTEVKARFDDHFPLITEDTMPGELSNIVAGRIAALYNLHGPNYVTDAACASAMAAMTAAIEGLEEYDYDVAIAGGIDANMSPSTFVKFCKIGALSATGTRPYAKGADGFVMGEGAAVFILKRLEDAERDGDKIYAVIRGFGGSSDGKGKGITAPNPIGQKFAVMRAWENAGVSPATASLIEGHGTSTSVGDAVELQCLQEVFGEFAIKPQSIALGSVKSNIGHLKGGAGAAGMMKAALALHEKVLPPSINFHEPNPAFDFKNSPFFVNTELRPWELKNGLDIRRCGVSAFGFGGTNFHAVLEEYIPGRIREEGRTQVSMHVETPAKETATAPKKPLRGAYLRGGSSLDNLLSLLEADLPVFQGGFCPPFDIPEEKDIKAPHRLAIDYSDAAELASKLERAIKALRAEKPGWRVLNAKGIFYGKGAPGKVAFLFTGQGSQYANMLDELRKTEPIVAETLRTADNVMKPHLGKPISEFIYVDANDASKVAEAEERLKQTEITQPAVLTVDTALSRLMQAYGIAPDMAMGHSLGEYGALVCAGVLSFEDALLAVSARGHQMAHIRVDDKGKMAAIFGPYEKIGEILKKVKGYVEIANINSNGQSVIGGTTQPVLEAMELCKEAGFHVAELNVSHAFHTQIVASVSGPLKEVLDGMPVKSPSLPVIANVTGDFYPSGNDAKPQITDLLSRQVASPVQFVQGVKRLYEAGVRVFVEMGPKKALNGFVKDILSETDDLFNLFTNMPKIADAESFNQALCGMYAAGHGRAQPAAVPAPQPAPEVVVQQQVAPPAPAAVFKAPSGDDQYQKLGRLFVDFMDKAKDVFYAGGAAPAKPREVWITGASLGLPGVDGVFQDSNVARILNGDQFILPISKRFREAMVDKNILRLVKTDKGGPRFESIGQIEEVVKLAGQKLNLDLMRDFDFPEERIQGLDVVTMLAIGAGLDAMRDAGIPLVMNYRTTSTGSSLPHRWMLPEKLRDETGIIFASAFPGYNAYADEIRRYQEDLNRKKQIELLSDIRKKLTSAGDSSGLVKQVDEQIAALEQERKDHPYVFDRHFLFRVLGMGHSQFAEYIGARGPNIHINAACSSGTMGLGLAKTWIETGQCRRVIVISADDITGEDTLDWFVSGFLAVGAAATDERIEDAALPFDRRRHGLIVGMGSAAVVVESGDAARERGLSPICEVLGSVSANSAFHGSRLDVTHIKDVMEDMVGQAEKDWGIDRHEIAGKTVFISHETYTPARGGSASAEVTALRHVFKESADKIVIANTKGYTGHPMAVGIEDVVGIKILETGIVPPVANVKEIDPEFGSLNLSKGGQYPVTYGLRLAAGFGSQISMCLLRWVPTTDGRRRSPSELGYAYRIADQEKWNQWLREITGKPAATLEVYKRNLRIAEPELHPGFATSNGNGKQVAEVQAPAPAPVAAPVVQAPSADGVQETILKLIAEKTGYPADMLDPDLDLEADLGIDTVKQAELFAEVRNAYGIERDDTIQLADFPTLKHIVQFVYLKRPDLAATPPVQVTKPAGDREQVLETILELIAEKTGYPKDMLDPDLDLEADLGIDTVKQAELFAEIRAKYDIPRDDSLVLSEFPTLNHIAGFVMDRRPGQPAKVEAPPVPQDSSTEVLDTVLQLIAEKTGYPADMLDPDLDLEADLGIDTVKQAELFAEIRGKYGIPRDDSLNLAEFPTLNHIVRFVLERRPAAVAVETAAAAPVPAPAPNAIMGSLERALEVPRRIPVAMLRPGLELCKATGAQIREGGTYLLMSDDGGVGKALEKELKKRKAAVIAVDPAADREELEKTIAQQPIDGVFWLPALDARGPVWEMTHAEWKALTHRNVKLLHAAMRAIVRSQEQAPFLISATRLGGRFGYDEKGALSPIGGAVCGFTKAYKREHPEAVVKVVDFEEGVKPAAMLKTLFGELEHDPGIVEVGYFDEKRWTVGLQEQPWPEEEKGMKLASDSVFLVTGAAGSIVSAIVADLARVAGGGGFHLLDLAEKPDPVDADLQLFRKDKESLKRELFARLSAEGKKVTPVMIEKALAALERKDAALQAIEAIERSGGKAHYYSVNLLAPEAMAAVIQEVRKTSGRIDVLMHAGGLEISQLLPNKTTAEFDLVFDVKADGWYNMMASLADFPVHRMMVFSSIAGRFGNGGQTDYSAANDFLCKSMSNLKSARPGSVGIALDWTAWDAIGMASRGSIPTVMKQAGIDMLPPAAGIGFLQKALTACGVSTEMVVAQSLGRMLDEFDPSGGIDLDKWNEAIRQSGSLMVQAAESAGLYRGLVLSGSFDPSKQPFLYDHQINGTPVLPGVMGIEAMAEAAQALAPGWRVAEVFDVAFLSPFKFYRSEPRKVYVQCFLTAEGEDIIGHCKLSGVRKLHGKDEEEVTEHFTGKVRLTMRPEGEAPNLGIKPKAKKDGVGAKAIYELYFHGPAYQTIESAWTENGRLLALMADKLPAGHDPETAPLLAWPRHIETCFQAAGLIEMGRHDRMGLPAGVERVSFLKTPDAKARLFALVDPQPEGYEVSIVDDSGTVCISVTGYKTSALPGGIDEGKNEVLKKLF